MPEEGGDTNLTAVEMDKGCLSLTQTVWPALSPASGAVWAGEVCPLQVRSSQAGGEKPGTELDPNRPRRCWQSPPMAIAVPR